MGVNAGCGLGRIQPIVFRKGQGLLAKIRRIQLLLMVEDPVVKRPEGRNFLICDAMGRFGCGMGPGVNRVDREVLVDDANVIRKLLREVVTKSFGELAAIRTLKVTKDDDCYLGVGRAERGPVSGQMLKRVEKRAVVQIPNRPADEALAIRG